ncbi:MAG TPA: DNA-binding protein [Nitrososphaeraceae archaeon]|nr:DNA-binding protein [Nitrososphaeraceae archaeon]
MKSEEDRELEIIKARKMRELREQAAATERRRKIQDEKSSLEQSKKQTFLNYVYDRADEVLSAAEAQYPSQTMAVINRILDLIERGDIQQKISGGELLSLFRMLGLHIRMNTTIKIEDHGKLVSFSDKLKADSVKNEIETS